MSFGNNFSIYKDNSGEMNKFYPVYSEEGNSNTHNEKITLEFTTF